MLSFWPILALAGILPFGGGPDAEPFPVSARGDIRFELDAARFRTPTEAPLEIYLSIPQVALTPSPDSVSTYRVMVEVQFENAHGDEIGRARDEMRILRAPDSQGDVVLSPRHLLTLRPKAPEGTQQLRVRIEDLSGMKTGLFDRMRKRMLAGEARGRFGAAGTSCGMSDIVLTWDVDRSSSATTLRRRLQPNPLRYYGLYHTTLLFYVERYGSGGALPYRILRESDDQLVASGSDTARVGEDGVAGYLLRADVGRFPAGSYRIEIAGSGADTCTVSAPFEVLWDSASWNQDQPALLEQAYVLLSPTEYERVQAMSRGEAEAYMRDLWGSHDPNPTTGYNELEATYRSRAEHANSFYGTTFRKGMLTDRGRVYIRYGAPDDVTSELNPQDEEKIANVLPTEVATNGVDIIRNPQRPNSRDDSAYEVWYYQIRGEPLFPDQENPVQRTGIKFIFVDDMGYGDMRLIYTNLSGAF
jgi:GWxTD domain-containing protein